MYAFVVITHQNTSTMKDWSTKTGTNPALNEITKLHHHVTNMMAIIKATQHKVETNLQRNLTNPEIPIEKLNLQLDWIKYTENFLCSFTMIFAHINDVITNLTLALSILQNITDPHIDLLHIIQIQLRNGQFQSEEIVDFMKCKQNNEIKDEIAQDVKDDDAQADAQADARADARADAQDDWGWRIKVLLELVSS